MADSDVELPLEDGPWDGMRDSIAPTTRKPGKYQLGQNIYPLDPNIADGLVGRPGVRLLGAQLGTAGRRRVQGLYQFTKKSGAEFTIAIVGGYFYALTWGGEVWTEVLTGAQLGAAAIVLSQTAKVAFLTFHDQVIISDGVNTPWAWDGTTGGGLTKLTNAPVIYGQPTMYAGRWLGIKAADPTTFVWSEADVLNTGFEAGGYNNAWTITQTNPNRLYRIHGTEEGLLVLRARSSTRATGPVGPNFSSQSTQEGMDATNGTTSPFGLVSIGSSVVLVDADIHPQLYRSGASALDPLWTDLRETLSVLPRTLAIAEKAIGVLYTPASLLLLAVADQGSDECNLLLVYDVKGPTPAAVALWGGWTMTALAMVKHGATASLGTPYLLHGDTDGRVYLHGNPGDDGPYDDELASGTVPISHIMECQPLGYSTKREKVFDRIDISVRALSRMTLAVSATTPRGVAPSQTIVIDPEIPPSVISLWDVGLWDEMPWDRTSTFTGEEAHGDVGVDLTARWIKPRIAHAQLGEQFGLIALTVQSFVSSDDPEAP